MARGMGETVIFFSLGATLQLGFEQTLQIQCNETRDSLKSMLKKLASPVLVKRPTARII